MSTSQPAGPKVPLARISGTGHYLPERRLTNADLETMMETSDAWIRDRTGIQERRIAADTENTSDMAAAAGRVALERAGITAADLDMIIVGTVTGDVPMPATAALVQHKLGASHCPAFDISAACAGFIYGISIAEKFVATGAAKHVLVIGVELLSRIVDWSERTTCVLFGDGAGAVVVSPSNKDGRGILSTHLFTDGSLFPILLIPGGGTAEPFSQDVLDRRRQFVQMAGPEVMKAAVRYLAASAKTALESNQLATDQLDWVVAHQANIRIIQAVAQRISIPLERFYITIQKYGNTSSATVPIALSEMTENQLLKPGQTVLLCALGAGISWGSAVIRW